MVVAAYIQDNILKTELSKADKVTEKTVSNIKFNESTPLLKVSL